MFTEEELRAAQDEMKARHALGIAREPPKRPEENTEVKPEAKPEAKVRFTKKRGSSGGRIIGHMHYDDPLYEMLPSWKLLDTMKYYPREVIRFPPHMRSSGIQESVTQSAAKIIRQFLLDERKSQCDRQGRNRFIQVLVNLTNIASRPGPQAVAAATLLFDRGFGKAKPSDEELDATKLKGGFQIIYINKVEGNIPVEDAPQEPAEPVKQLPEFIEAEFGEAQ